MLQYHPQCPTPQPHVVSLLLPFLPRCCSPCTGSLAQLEVPLARAVKPLLLQEQLVALAALLQLLLVVEEEEKMGMVW